MSWKMKNTFKTLAAIAIVAVTASCQAIPQGGAVHQGLDNFAQAQQQVVYAPDRPVPDANQEDIVRGFLQASSSSADDYQIARQFLTTNYKNVWNPYSATLIDEGGRKFTQISPNQTKISLSVVTTLDETGTMTQQVPGNETEVHFELRRENGEWRIQSAPNAVILDRTTFKDVWSPQQLFFWSDEGFFVRDSRWFLNRGGLATQIVEQLIAGPQKLLNGAIKTSFPAGTTLSQETVIVESGVAYIDVTSELLTATPDQLEMIKNQLALSLNPVPGIAEFVVTVNKAPLFSGVVVPELGSFGIAPADDLHWPAALQEDKFGFISTTGFMPNSDFDEQIKELQPGQIITDRDSNFLVAQNKSGVFLITPTETVLLDDRKDLLETSVDNYGYVWTATKTNPHAFTITTFDGFAQNFEVPWLEGQEVEAFKVSPNGTQLALLIKGDDQLRVIVTGIVRSEAGTPSFLIDPEGQTAFWVKNKAIDLDWIDGQQVAVLERTQQGATRILTGGLGFFPEERVAVQNAVAIHGETKLSKLLLLDDQGEVWIPQGSTGWQKSLSGVTLLSKRD